MIGLLINDKMGIYEKEQKKASYRTIIENFVGDIVLCNNIVEIDPSVYDNMENGQYYINRATGEEATKAEYDNDIEDIIELQYCEIYQYYLCNLSDYEKEQVLNYNLIVSYSDMLDCDVLCVDHYGTRWDYVLTDCPLFETWEELEAYNNKGE